MTCSEGMNSTAKEISCSMLFPVTNAINNKHLSVVVFHFIVSHKPKTVGYINTENY